MISKKDISTIIRIAKKYQVKILFLFGSSVLPNGKSNDIDIAVKGIAPEYFFKFYGELVKKISKPVDLIDLSEQSLFNTLIEKNGIKIYG